MLAGLAAVLALFTGLWLVSLLVRNSSIVDMWWGPAIVAIGFTYKLTAEEHHGRGDYVLAFLTFWAFRLAWHIGSRNVGQGEDFRYAKWRREHGTSWWWFSYFKVFLLQAVVAWIISIPVYYLVAAPQSDRGTYWDVAAVLVCFAGFLFEGIADEQLTRFKSDPANRGGVLDTGLWRYSRHPNYFGEAVFWWGIGLWSVVAGYPLGLIGPAIMTFLLIRISGVALLEKTLRETKPEYRDYIRRTSSFVPMPPKAF